LRWCVEQRVQKLGDVVVGLGPIAAIGHAHVVVKLAVLEVGGRELWLGLFTAVDRDYTPAWIVLAWSPL
jgi:disulfide bond formation protein DsbB